MATAAHNRLSQAVPSYRDLCSGADGAAIGFGADQLDHDCVGPLWSVLQQRRGLVQVYDENFGVAVTVQVPRC